MDNVIYYNELYDLYGVLLTDKQRLYFEDYYFNNLSFSEMADNYGVSRNAVFKQLHIVTDKLDDYENKLRLREKRMKINELLGDVPLTIKEKVEEILMWR